MMFDDDFQMFKNLPKSHFFKVCCIENQKSIPQTTGVHFAVKNLCRIILQKCTHLVWIKSVKVKKKSCCQFVFCSQHDLVVSVALEMPEKVGWKSSNSLVWWRPPSMCATATPPSVAALLSLSKVFSSAFTFLFMIALCGRPLTMALFWILFHKSKSLTSQFGQTLEKSMRNTSMLFNSL